MNLQGQTLSTAAGNISLLALPAIPAGRTRARLCCERGNWRRYQNATAYRARNLCRQPRDHGTIEGQPTMTDPGPDPRWMDGTGRAELMRAIHDEHGPALTRYVLRLTRGDIEFTEEAVQESLLRLWQNDTILTTYSDESRRAWLHTVARNLVIDDRRSARYKRELQTETVPERGSQDIFDPAVDRWVVTDALRSLSPEHRAVLVRAHYLGQTAVEIARHEGIPPGTVKSRLHYALRALRIALEEKGVVR